MIYQLQAGSILDSVKNLILKHEIASKKDLERLLESLSFFSVKVIPSHSMKFDECNFEAPAIYGVAENLVSRGLPTRPSLSLEHSINSVLNHFGINTPQDQVAQQIGSIKYEINADKHFANLLWRSLHVIDPDAAPSAPPVAPGSDFSTYGSYEERQFIEAGLPKVIPEHLIQLIESERQIKSLVSTVDDSQTTQQTAVSQDFFRQRVDFSLEFPYADSDTERGFVFEIDGSQHSEVRNKQLDAKRDSILKEAGFAVIRIPAKEVENPYHFLDTLRSALDRNIGYFSVLTENIQKPLKYSSFGKLALSVALVPFAVSRILKVLFRLINNGTLDINANLWRIAIIERDVECAQIANNEFQKLTSILSTLSGQKSHPEIYLKRISAQNSDETQTHINLEENFDLCIDISMLSRSFFNTSAMNIQAKHTCIIRSSCAKESSRQFLFDVNIVYEQLGEYITKDGDDVFVPNSEIAQSLKILLADIFRKTDFRPGQLQILDRALCNKSVIGLLPTGHGKSLTYQLAALLQPGVCAVIDPLKSLMRDQDRGLRENGIDGCLYINSSLSTLERKQAIEKLASGEVLFAFIAPERLQSQEFRNTLLSADLENKISFSYCVIDEAHCVSEWGHDFRTSYLRVGENARRFCKSWQRSEIPLFALTATASYDVLADIQRELDVEGGDSIITLNEEEMRRDELNFRIIDIDLLENDPVRINSLNSWDIRKSVSEAKIHKLNNLLDETNPQNEPTIVFCPHKKGSFGAKDLEARIHGNIGNLYVTGTFTGTGDASFEEAKDLESLNQETQDKFIAGNIDILFATKAFGMGIDKHNIRNIFHFNYPSSIEGYYQEAGRAGRDRKSSLCTILYCGQTFDKLYPGESITLDSSLMRSFHDNNFKGAEFEKRWLYELLNEIHSPKTNLAEKAVRIVEAAIRQHMDIDSCNLYDKNNCLRIYINPDMGFFDLNAQDFPYARSFKSKNTLSEELVHTVQNALQDHFSTTTITQPHSPGIESLLSSMTFNEEQIVSIPFENDAADDIAQIVSTSNHIIDRRTVLSAASYCRNPLEFSEKLLKEVRKSNQSFTLFQDAEEYLQRRFFSIREQEATMKSIYRLMSIGVISDYTVDYVARQIDCTIVKKSDLDYKKETARYLKKYYADERVEVIMDRLDDRPGESLIQKCLNLIIEFTYEEIAKQRRSAIEEMERACNYGLEHPDSDSFEEYIMMYMNSKYARRQYLPTDTDYGNVEDMAIVDKYIALIRDDPGGEINNLKHLRGATALMHAQRPDNYVFLLLSAFATFILEKGRNAMISKAFDEAVEGFERYAQENNLPYEVLNSEIDAFTNKIAWFDVEAASPIRLLKDLLIHKQHLKWLKNYRSEKLQILTEDTK